MNILSMGQRTYELPIAKTYVRHWGMAEAVRELLQNAIDSESPFEFEFGADTLRIRSRYSKLSAATLLLGQTSKAESTDTIGSFGEGYKIALLVLTREGYPVTVHNGDRTWRPVFRRSRQFDAEVLCITDEPASERRDGLEFEVGGLSPGDIATIRDGCLHMQNDIGEVHDVTEGRILRARSGKLYVGGLFVCDTQLQFGYDIKPEFLRLERDRQTVSNFDLLFLTKSMWFETERWEEIAKMIGDEVKDLEYAEYGTPEMVKEACYRAFRERHPGAVIAKNQEELEALIKRGMTNVVVCAPYYPMVSQAKAYKSEVVIPVTPPADVLRRWLSANRHAMRGAAIEAFRKDLIEQAEGWRLK
jgi:hypothetical protein